MQRTERKWGQSRNGASRWAPTDRNLLFQGVLIGASVLSRSSRFLLRPAGFEGQVAGLATFRTILRQSYEAHEGRRGLRECRGGSDFSPDAAVSAGTFSHNNVVQTAGDPPYHDKI